MDTKNQIMDIRKLIDEASNIASKSEEYFLDSIECEIRMPIPKLPSCDHTSTHVKVEHFTKEQSADIRRITSNGTSIIVKKNLWRKSIGNISASVSVELDLDKSDMRGSDLVNVREFERHSYFGKMDCGPVNNLKIEIKQSIGLLMEIEWDKYDNVTKEYVLNHINHYSIAWWPFPKPKSVTTTEMFWRIKDSFLTPKFDGVRVLCLIYLDSFCILGESSIIHGEYKPNYQTIYDCEMIGTNLHVFDLPYHLKYLEGDFSSRYNLLKSIIIKNIGEYTVRIKVHERVSSHRKLANLYNKYIDLENTDGIIMITDDKWKSCMYKSKPVTTVDVQYTQGRLLFGNGELFSRTHQDFEEGTILEYTDDGRFIKVRDDKIIPNLLRPISTDTIKLLVTGKGCHSLRAFNNSVKSSLLNRVKALSSNLIDVGSGKGGDLAKWNVFSHVTAIDPKLTLDARHTTAYVQLEYSNIEDWLNKGINIEDSVASVFFVPNSESIIYMLCERKIKAIAAIVMSRPLNINSEYLKVSTQDSNITINMQGSRTAEYVSDKLCNIKNIDGYTVEKMKIPLTFGTKHEIKFSECYECLIIASDSYK
jgi:hypothetical protein